MVLRQLLMSCITLLAEAAKKNGISVLSITGCYHFAALWPETEFLAKNNLVGFACTAFKPSVAPAGAKEPFFGTNPISMAWPYRRMITQLFLIWQLLQWQKERL